jgi:transposase
MAHELRPLPDAEQAILKALSTRRRLLTESIAIEKTRLKQAFDPLIVESCREMIALVEDKRQAIEEDLDRRIDAQDGMACRRAILASIPGVGARISALAVVEMPELGAIDRKAAASLAGLAPHPSQSGLSRGRNAISGGRPCVRAAFTMAALVATRSHPKFKQAYLDLRAAGKPAKIALVAIARRLVTLANANALIRDNIPFNGAACP